MSKASMLFLGSKPIGYHCLHYLIEQREALSLEIVGVLTNEQATLGSTLSLRQLAETNEIPVYNTLEEMPVADYIYSVQYHEILKRQDIDKAKILALNLHMAPLPEYRGCNQFSFAIAEDKKVFGTTIHVMDSGIDHGDIVAEKRFAIPDACWIEELYNLTFEHSIDLFIETISTILKGDYTVTPQSNLVASRGTSIHYRNEIQQLKQIDLSWDKSRIERHIRATYMPGFEPPYAMIDGQRMYFKKDWK